MSIVGTVLSGLNREEVNSVSIVGTYSTEWSL